MPSYTPEQGRGDWGETGGFLVERKGTNRRQTDPRPSLIGRAAVERAHEQGKQQAREQRLREEEVRRKRTEQRQKAKEESSGGEGFGHDVEVAEQQQRGASSSGRDLPPSIVVTQYDDNESETKEEFHAYNKVRSLRLSSERRTGRLDKDLRKREVRIEQYLLAMLAGKHHQDMQNTRCGVDG
ncbi:hypothetical protein LTS10_012081 [Elasticomyces elasticus]|nr:hypothetical protein LTS10_012081 [Elasticomyces elasticus]